MTNRKPAFVDRSAAVNLALILREDSTGTTKVTDKGVEILTDAVIEMSVALSVLEGISSELLEALKSIEAWAESQSDAQSKGGHATFDLAMLREQRDIAQAAIAKAESKS